MPWSLVIMVKFNLDTSQNGSILVSLAVALLSLTLGLINHDIGSRIEKCIDNFLQKNKFKDFNKVWDKYLNLCMPVQEQPIRLKYISEIIDRYRFELNAIPAIVFSFFGFRELSLINSWDSCVFWLCIAAPHFVLLIYLLWESASSAILLHEQREKLLEINHSLDKNKLQ